MKTIHINEVMIDVEDYTTKTILKEAQQWERIGVPVELTKVGNKWWLLGMRDRI